MCIYIYVYMHKLYLYIYIYTHALYAYIHTYLHYDIYIYYTNIHTFILIKVDGIVREAMEQWPGRRMVLVDDFFCRVGTCHECKCKDSP